MTSWSADQQAVVLDRARSASASEREAAFNMLFDAMRGSVFALAHHLTGNQGDAEDAVQDCFLGVYQAIPRFRGDCLLSTWVYRIALRSVWKVRGKQRTSSDSLNLNLEGAAETATEDAAPDDIAEVRQRSSRVQSALVQLSEEHRTVLSLFAVDGLGHREIANVLGIPEGTVWSRLHAARKRLAVEVETQTAAGRNRSPSVAQ